MIDALARALIEERGFQPVGKLSIPGGPELDESLQLRWYTSLLGLGYELCNRASWGRREYSGAQGRGGVLHLYTIAPALCRTRRIHKARVVWPSMLRGTHADHPRVQGSGGPSEAGLRVASELLPKLVTRSCYG